MRCQRIPRRIWTAAAVLLLGCIGLGGCKALSDRLTHWTMLGAEALDDPIHAVGGDGVVFTPKGEDQPQSRRQLASAAPQQLVAYYAPIFVQQRVNTAAQPHPYPPEYDQIGEARLRREADGELKAFVAGPPKVYAIYEKRQLSGHDHVQLTYTAWYPAHPKMKAIDLEEADIDSCVVRVTLPTPTTPSAAALRDHRSVRLLSQGIRRGLARRPGGAEQWTTGERQEIRGRADAQGAPSTGRSRVWWMSRARPNRCAPARRLHQGRRSQASSAWAVPPGSARATRGRFPALRPDGLRRPLRPAGGRLHGTGAVLRCGSGR